MGLNEVKHETPLTQSAAGRPAPEIAQGGPPDRASSDAAFHKVVEGVPVAGPTLVFIVKKWGLTGLLLFFAGGIFVLGLVYFGVVPQGLVSDKYRTTPAGAPTPVAPEGIALKGSLPLETVESEPGWLQALVDLFRREGIDAQEAEPGTRSSVGAVEYAVPDATKPFAWVLSARNNFELAAMAFRVTRDGGGAGPELIETLKPEGDTRSVQFSVPACRKGDRLIAVVRVWSRAAPPEDVRFALGSVSR